MKINPYLSFNGNCKAAFEFYADCLHGHIDAMFTHGESPMADQADPAMREQIMHAQLTIDGQVLMGGDCPPQFMEKPQGFSVAINLDNTEEAARIFSALAEGGQISMPLEETFWALSFGMVTDRFGTPWMVNCPQPECGPA